MSFSGPLGELVRQCRRSFYLAWALTFVIEVLSLAPIIYMLNLYDRVMTSRSEITMFSLLLLVTGIYGLWTALDWARARMMVRISLRIDWELADRVFDASFRRVLGHRTVSVTEVIGDLVVLRQFFTGGPLRAMMTAPFAILFGVMAWLFHIHLALFAVAALLITTALTFINGIICGPAMAAAEKAQNDSRQTATQSVRNSEAAFALGMQDNLRRRWHGQYLNYLELHVNSTEASGAVGMASSLLGHLIPSLQMTLGIWLAINGYITGGMVIASTMLIGKTLAPLRAVLNSWKDISGARRSYDRLNRLLIEDRRIGTRMALPRPTGQIQVVGMSVMPPNADVVVLKELDFAIEPGEVLAVLGPSAAGKTSLTKTLIGMWKPTAGAVRLDGADVADWLNDDLGRHVGYMPQDIEFFNGTVAENVARFGDVDANKVVEATRAVGVHRMILGFPKGYDTQLGEGGHYLTSGQKQRIALARALYDRPCYVVLDEPNANLDEKGQVFLQRTITAIKNAKTTVVFTTHRMQMLEVADKVLILSDGHKRWFGTVAEFQASLGANNKVATIAA